MINITQRVEEGLGGTGEATGGVKDDRRNEQRRRGNRRKGKRGGREQIECRGGKNRGG